MSVLLSEGLSPRRRDTLSVHATPRIRRPHPWRIAGRRARLAGNTTTASAANLLRRRGRAVKGQGGRRVGADGGGKLSGLGDLPLLAKPKRQPAHPATIRGPQHHAEPAIAEVFHALAGVVLRDPAPARPKLEHRPQVAG